jgi:ribosomal protein L7Ae-like RNA K-turn-binding protein
MLDADNKVLGALTMARKAGKLVLGFDAVKDTLTAKTAKAVVIAADISPKTEKEVRFFCGRAAVDIIKTTLTMDDLGRALSKKTAKRSGVISVTDSGLAGLVRTQQNGQPAYTEEKI